MQALFLWMDNLLLWQFALLYGGVIGLIFLLLASLATGNPRKK